MEYRRTSIYSIVPSGLGRGALTRLLAKILSCCVAAPIPPHATIGLRRFALEDAPRSRTALYSRDRKYRLGWTLLM